MARELPPFERSRPQTPPPSHLAGHLDGICRDRLRQRPPDSSEHARNYVGPFRREEQGIADLRWVWLGLHVTARVEPDTTAERTLQSDVTHSPLPRVAAPDRDADLILEVIFRVSREIHSAAPPLGAGVLGWLVLHDDVTPRVPSPKLLANFLRCLLTKTAQKFSRLFCS